MSTLVLEGRDNYEIYFSHQADDRPFNRGAVKNLGFLAVKENYPAEYADITFVFHDIDTVPNCAGLFDYQTAHGTVKHFYGFEYALGGIVAMKGSDFEATNGFPNYWGWGKEDHVLQQRCLQRGLRIDRSQFVPIGSPEVLHLFDGISRLITHQNHNNHNHNHNNNNSYGGGLSSLTRVNMSVNTESSNPLDNVSRTNTDKLYYVNIADFETGVDWRREQYHEYDLREPQEALVKPRRAPVGGQQQAQWSNIPFYPTAAAKRDLVNRFGAQQAEQMVRQVYASSSSSTTPTPAKIPRKAPVPPPHRYSPQYAQYIGAKPRAMPSANIGLGGILM
jgi:hypothetical protein